MTLAIGNHSDPCPECGLNRHEASTLGCSQCIQWRRDLRTPKFSITTNGNQWQTIGLMPDEIQRVIDALIPFLPNA